MIFTLTAMLGSETRTCPIEVFHPSYEGVRLARSLGEPDPEAAALRFDAVTEAIREILNRGAHGPNRPFWATGAIELRNPNGEVIHAMPAKEVDD